MFRLQCKCSKYLEVPESLANQKIKCKHCGKILTVPAPPKQASAEKMVDESSPFFIKGFRQCASCGKNYPATVKVCVGCGIDLDSGALLYASLEASRGDQPTPKDDGQPMGFFPRLLRLLGIGKKGGAPAGKP